jgi:hypothetical protein
LERRKHQQHDDYAAQFSDDPTQAVLIHHHSDGSIDAFWSDRQAQVIDVANACAAATR